MATDFENIVKGREKVKFKDKETKGETFRKKIKQVIEKGGPKKLSERDPKKIMEIDKSLKDLRKEFDLRFDKPKFEKQRPKRVPGEKKEMQPLSKGGRAMYKSGTRGCKLAKKGKGRAYGKNS